MGACNAKEKPKKKGQNDSDEDEQEDQHLAPKQPIKAPIKRKPSEIDRQNKIQEEENQRLQSEQIQQDDTQKSTVEDSQSNQNDHLQQEFKENLNQNAENRQNENSYIEQEVNEQKNERQNQQLDKQSKDEPGDEQVQNNEQNQNKNENDEDNEEQKTLEQLKEMVNNGQMQIKEPSNQVDAEDLYVAQQLLKQDFESIKNNDSHEDDKNINEQTEIKKEEVEVKVEDSTYSQKLNQYIQNDQEKQYMDLVERLSVGGKSVQIVADSTEDEQDFKKRLAKLLFKRAQNFKGEIKTAHNVYEQEGKSISLKCGFRPLIKNVHNLKKKSIKKFKVKEKPDALFLIREGKIKINV